MSFSKKCAVITGGSGGIGWAIAEGLLAEGAHVALIDLKEPSTDLDRFQGRALFYKGDVSDPDFIAKTFEDLAKAFGRLDHLVNAAGVLWFDRDRSLAEIDLETWDRVMEINLKSVVSVTRHAVELMQRTANAKPESGGSMVHIASVQAIRGDSVPQDAYQASKAGMIALSKSLAIQFAGKQIRSNALLPGGTLSAMQQRWYDDPDMLQRAAEAIPLGRVGKVEDMANAALFLLSEKASFITGIELIVDGGRTALP